jgi:hypothetical protein
MLAHAASNILQSKDDKNVPPARKPVPAKTPSSCRTAWYSRQSNWKNSRNYIIFLSELFYLMLVGMDAGKRIFIFF